MKLKNPNFIYFDKKRPMTIARYKKNVNIKPARQKNFKNFGQQKVCFFLRKQTVIPIAKADKAKTSCGNMLWQYARSEIIQNSKKNIGKARSAKLRPKRFNRKNFIKIIDKAIVKKINKTEAILNNIIALFYHKKSQKRRELSLHFQFFSV